MKKCYKTIVCTMLLLGGSMCAHADFASDTETLLNWAENTYPDLFPSHQGTQSLAPWLFRYYPEQNLYAGVNANDQGVYVMGGPWGNDPVYIESLASMISVIDDNSSVDVCDTTNIPAGISYSQSGNVVTVTTNGQCIVLPSNTNLCEVPDQSSATGISVLTSTSVTSSNWSGITLNVPLSSLPFNPLEILTSGFKICTINAPTDESNLVVNMNVCMDVTADTQESLQPLVDDGSVTITPPLTVATNSTMTNQVVASCFDTDAMFIEDAHTHQTWFRQNGEFIEIPSF